MSAKDERRAMAQWESRVRHQLIPKIKGSSHTICLAPEDPDPKSAVELGYMILLDKPIITVVPPGREISAKLRAISDLVIEGEMGPEVAEQIARFMRDHPPAEETQT